MTELIVTNRYEKYKYKRYHENISLLYAEDEI